MDSHLSTFFITSCFFSETHGVFRLWFPNLVLQEQFRGRKVQFILDGERLNVERRNYPRLWISAIDTLSLLVYSINMRQDSFVRGQGFKLEWPYLWQRNFKWLWDDFYVDRIVPNVQIRNYLTLHLPSYIPETPGGHNFLSDLNQAIGVSNVAA